MAFVDSIRRKHEKDEETACTRRGYYLVKDGTRHFISPDVNPAALERVADRMLSDSEGWDYWIDYSYGIDVHGKPAWSNVDQTDRFI